MQRGIGLIAMVLCLAAASGGDTPADELFQAIRNNDLNYLKAQLSNGADVNTRDRRGATLLMHAAAFGSPEAVRLLLDSGAGVNAKNSFDATALLWGAGDPRKAAMLVAKGADVNARSKQGRTPLMVAANCDGCSETVRLLLSKGADPKQKDGQGNSALRLAADLDDFESVRLIIDAGVPPDAPDGDGTTALQSAAVNCNLAETKFLLSKGADVNLANTFSGEVKFGKIQLIGLTPLMWAAPFCKADVVQTLLDAGAKVNVKDIRDMTPIMLAVTSETQDLAVVRALLKAGAGVNGKSNMGETALDWAHKFGNPEVIAALTAAGARAGDPLSPPQRPASAPKSAQQAVEYGVALLQRTSTEFFQQSGCVGCHHQAFTTMAVVAARAGGVPVNDAAAEEHVKMMEGQWTGVQEAVLLRIDIGGMQDNEMYSLLAMAAARYPSNAITDTMAAYVAAVQRRDGAWRLGGEARVPLEYSAVSRTAVAMHTLQLYGSPAQRPDFDRRIARAREFLLGAKASTTDELAMQLAGLAWAGAARDKVREVGRTLVACQRSDGGWAGNRNLPSDPYATGQSLWALRESGTLTASDPAYQRGVKYLLGTQWTDGSWYVRSRATKFQPYFQSGFPYEHDQWISSTATGWAVMALAPAIETEKRASR